MTEAERELLLMIAERMAHRFFVPTPRFLELIQQVREETPKPERDAP